MQPKTKIEKAVKALEPKLPKLSAEQKIYAANKLFPKLCYATKHKAFCLECGSEVDVKLIINEKVTCLTCNSKLKVERTRKIKDYTQLKIVALGSTIKEGIYDFQVTRCFNVRVFYRKGEAREIIMWEINQRWYDKKTKKVTINSMIESGYNGNYCGELEIRKGGFSITYYTNKNYDPFPYFFLPESKFRPDLIKRGITAKRLEDIKFSTILKRLDECPKIETLLKLGLVDIIEKWTNEEIEDYWPALKSCFRNKYKIKHPDSYKDYVYALAFLDKDLRNAYYVCPEDFVKAHDYYINLKTKRELANTGLSAHKKIQLANPRYQREKGKFLDLEFTSGKISVRPLQSVEEFYEEGELFKHCIFQNSYFDKKHSLLFSSRYDGIKVETFELDLRTFKILQSHGWQHKKSKHSDKIKDLILKNVSQIKKCMEPYKLKRKNKQSIAS